MLLYSNGSQLKTEMKGYRMLSQQNMWHVCWSINSWYKREKIDDVKGEVMEAEEEATVLQQQIIRAIGIISGHDLIENP